MSTLPIHSHYHAAAITLNNIGVTLMERKCYKQAVEVFEDSVTLMKIVASLTSRKIEKREEKLKRLEQRAISSWQNAQALLRKASHKLSHPDPDGDDPSLASSLAIHLEVVTLDDSAVAVQQAVLKQNKQESSSPGTSTFLVRIESSRGSNRISSFSPNDFHLYDVDASIILFNFGASSECLARLSNVPIECCESALSLSVLSYTIFHNNFWALESTQDCGVWADYLPLLILFLQNLVELSARRGKESDAWSYYMKLIEASKIFLERQPPLGGILLLSSTAPAA